MKKILLLTLLSTLLFTACDKEEINPGFGDSKVVFTVELPSDPITRSIGTDVSNINDLVYAVYTTEETTEEAALNNIANAKLFYRINKDQAVFTAEGKTNVEIELLNNQSYVILFWAQKDNKWFNNDEFDLTNIEFPSTADANDVDMAAFCGASYVSSVNGTVSKSITLKRPFAQVNIGTTLPVIGGKVNIQLDRSYVEILGAAKFYNVATGNTAGTIEKIEFIEASVPSATLDVKDGYQYVAMNYIFANNTVDVKYTIKVKKQGSDVVYKPIENTITSVPVRKNYRTNIVGNLLSTTANYEVVLDSKWAEGGNPGNVIEVWDGVSVSAPAYTEETKTWNITNGSELAWIANAINGTLTKTKSTSATPAYDAKTQKIILGNNIDLGGNEWVPIGTKANHFKGYFDGNHYVIQNFKITEKHFGEPQAALFGTVSDNPTFKNVKIENAKIVYPGEGDFYAAALIGTAYGTVTIENITVKNCEISGNNKVAGILAHDGVMSSLKIDNCHVLDSNISSSNSEDGGNVGGLVGLFQGVARSTTNNNPSYGVHIIKNSSVRNTVIDAVNSTNTGKRSNGEFVACIAGKVNQTLEIQNCIVENNTFTQNEGVTYVSPYGVFVGGDRLDDRKGTVIVDGVVMIDNGLTKTGNTFEAANAATFLKAISLVEDGDVVKLVGNVEFDVNNRTHNSGTYYDGMYYTGDKSFTIDLNDNTITHDGSVNDYLLNFKNVGSNANTITLKNGTLDAGTSAYCALATSSSNAQKITVNLEDINLINNNSGGAVLKIRGGTELNVKAGTIITGKNSYTGIEAVGNNTVVNIYDGAEIYQNGTSSYVGAIVGASYNATMNIYGGYGKSAKCGIIVMSTGATINVSGGEWIANNDGTVASDNNAVLVSQNNRYETGWACKSVLNVTGGTFKGGYNCYGMGPGVEADDAQINIKGGNFNADPTRFVKPDYKAVENNGIWTLVVNPVAKIGTTEYATLQEAFNVGGIITLLRDVTISETATLEGGKTATLDLNGKTLTAYHTSALVSKEGSHLIVKNGKVVAYESTVRAIGGKVEIESGEYTSTGTAVDSPSTYRYSLDSRDGGELVVNGGTFKSNNGMINVSSTVTINGGKFENIVEKSMTRHFAYVSAPLTINDGEFLGKANGAAGGCFFCGAAAGCDIQVKGGKFTSLWTSGSVNAIFEVYYGGTINVTGGIFNTNRGIANFVVENTDEATKDAYPYVAK